MNKKNIILIVVIFIIIPGLINAVSIQDSSPSDDRYVEIVQAIIASPKSAKLLHDGQDITIDFLNEYKESIENGDYSDAVDYLKEGGISISIQINGRNEFLLDGME
ncbi:hypothetical protein SAMN02745751_02973 [Dethiosulfatibacter aminovorans DSM 17477]|uniref:Uncharacterized protein n=1 Tax=Dethiosulfatibacter aminovorans DSM 17477 TaxID=1121476 RepID=A0A1M6KTB1_9FIRM|nr:hypothetical protein [Dethiosulfatibacter aminovorans]SHJ62104.1 hypothetical protein SAMN02745751_02973 [Dethiosulfatibacter aminovorans DSM 17477]